MRGMIQMEEKRRGKEYGKEKRVNKFVLAIVTIIDMLLFFGYIEIGRAHV